MLIIPPSVKPPGVPAASPKSCLPTPIAQTYLRADVGSFPLFLFPAQTPSICNAWSTLLLVMRNHTLCGVIRNTSSFQKWELLSRSAASRPRALTLCKKEQILHCDLLLCLTTSPGEGVRRPDSLTLPVGVRLSTSFWRMVWWHSRRALWVCISLMAQSANWDLF